MSISKLEKKLDKIEKELEKVRTSSFVDGWQTQRHAKRGRKWDILAQEKFKLQQFLDAVNNCKREKHNEDVFNHGECLECGCNIDKHED